MPKIFYLAVLRNAPRPAIELAVARDSSSFSRFTRGNYEQFMTLFSKTVAERTKPAERTVVEEKDYKFHAYAKSTSLCAIAITEQSYPDLVAQQLLGKMLDEFEAKHPYNTYSSPSISTANSLPLPSLDTYVIQYQNSNEVDSIGKVQKELDETKQVLHKTIESLLERGEKIDNLVQKSDDLSAQSKMFYTQAKKQNSCCLVM